MSSMSNITTHVFTVSELTPQLWKMMKAEPEDTIWYSLIGTLLQAMLVTSVLGMTIKYFTYFTNRDSPYLLWGIGVGTTIQLGELMMTCAEDYRLVYCGPDNFQDIFRFLVISDMFRLLMAAMFNIAAGGYYTWRVWMMCGRKIYMIPPLAIGDMVQMMMTVMGVVHGCKSPEVTVETIMQLPEKMPRVLKFFKIWGAVTLVVDGALCIIMTILLFKTQDSLFSKETKVFRKLISLVYETMLPPVICLIILETAGGSKGTPLTDMRRIITCILPVLYYHSALHTLCGRQDLRDLLEDKLASGGIHAISNGSGKGSGGRVYAAYSPGLRTLNNEESGIEMQSPISSSSTRKNPQMPMIKVEQTTVVSRSDEYILSTPEAISMPRSSTHVGNDLGESDDEKSVMTNKSAPVHHS